MPRITKIIKVLNRARRIYFTGRDPISRACVRTNAHAAPLPERFSMADPNANRAHHSHNPDNHLGPTTPASLVEQPQM